MRKKSYLNIDQFTTNFTPEASYILGLLFADGHVNKKTNEIRISCVKEDVDIFEKIFQKTGKWNRYNAFEKQRTRNNRPQGTLSCSEKTIRNMLANSDDFLLKNIPDDLKGYWYRGYVDGDGCWTINKTSKILKSGKISTFYNRKFVCTGPLQQDWTFMEKLLKNLNIKYKINKYEKHNRFSQLTVTGHANYTKLGAYLYWNYKNDKIGLSRKYEKWTLIVDSYL